MSKTSKTSKISKNSKTCLGMLCHGSYFSKSTDCSKEGKHCSFDIPKNIRLIKYARPTKVLMSNSLEDTDFYSNSCSLDKLDKESTRYFIHQNGIITKTTIKPRILTGKTLNMKLIFDDTVPGHNMGIFSQNKKIIDELTDKLISIKNTNLKDVLDMTSEYIKQKFPEGSIIDVHEFNCQSGDYIIKDTEFADVDIDELTEHFSNINMENIPYVDGIDLSKNSVMYTSLNRDAIEKKYNELYKRVVKRRGPKTVKSKKPIITKFRKTKTRNKTRVNKTAVNKTGLNKTAVNKTRKSRESSSNSKPMSISSSSNSKPMLISSSSNSKPMSISSSLKSLQSP